MKHKKIQQVLALALTLVLCLTACGTAQEPPVKEPEQTQTPSVETPEETVQPAAKNYWEMLDEVSDTSDLPDWTGEKMELSIWNAGGTDAVFGAITDENVVMKEIERVTGVTINVDDCFGNGGENIDAKLPKLVASNDFPTLVFGWDIDKQLKDLWDNGYLADLTEYYEDGSLNHVLHWLPLDQMQETLYDYCKDENGAYYKIPSVSVPYYCLAAEYTPEGFDPVYFQTYGMTPANAASIGYYCTLNIRDDILQALYPDAYSMADLNEIYAENGTFTEEQIFDLGLETPEDVIELLYDVQELLEKQEFKALNGSPVEVTYGPHTETDNWGWMYYLPQLVGITPTSDYFTVAEKNDDDGVLINKSIESQPIVDWMKILNQLVNDGVIVKDSLVDNAASFDEKILNGHYAVMYGNRATNADGSAEGWAYRPIWVKSNMDEYYYGFRGMSQRQSWSIFKDSVTEEQMDQVVHMIDYLSSEVGMKNMFWGPASAGLFTEDADGNRAYVDQELEDAMINRVDSKLPMTYGLVNTSMSEKAFDLFPQCGATSIYEPKYLVASEKERDPKNTSETLIYYNPGILPEYSIDNNTVKVFADNTVYSLGLSVEGIAQWWSARAGFENLIKKVIVSETDTEFDSVLEELRQYTVDNGFTDEALKEYNDLFIEKNESLLKKAGVIE